MADIVIRGMEMPKTCCQCDLKIYDPEMRWDENGIEQIGAWVCKRTREIIWNTKRGTNCPLVPLPAGHGRLIDADRLTKRLNDFVEWCRDDRRPGAFFVMDCPLPDSPTIVPAEGGNADGN